MCVSESSFGMIIFGRQTQNNSLYDILDVFVFSFLGKINTKDSQAFLFSLVNPGGNPIKILQKPDRCGHIRCDSDSGPTFGKHFSDDLVVYKKDTPSGFAGYHRLGNSFNCPLNADRNTFFTGKDYFDVSELEVFKVYF